MSAERRKTEESVSSIRELQSLAKEVARAVHELSDCVEMTRKVLKAAVSNPTSRET